MLLLLFTSAKAGLIIVLLPPICGLRCTTIPYSCGLALIVPSLYCMLQTKLTVGYGVQPFRTHVDWPLLCLSYVAYFKLSLQVLAGRLALCFYMQHHDNLYYD